MASSEIHVASLSATFGYSLRDHNLRDRWRKRDSNAFQNFKDFVDSISGQPNKNSAPNVDVENNDTNSKENQTDSSDLWVRAPSYKNEEDVDDVPQSNKCDDRLARKKEIVSSDDSAKQNHYGSSASVSPARTTTDVPTPMGAVSSLLRRWRNLEAENTSRTPPMSSSKMTSGDGYNNNNNNPNSSGGGENESLVETRSETRLMYVDTFTDWESDRTALSGRASDATEKEKTTLSGRASDATEKERTALSGRASDATEKDRTSLSGRALDATEKEKTTLSGRASDATEKERTALSVRASDATEKEKTTLSGRASDATEERTALSGRALDATEKERTALSVRASDATEKDRTSLSGRALDATEKEKTTLSGRASDATEKERTALSGRASDATEKDWTSLSGRALDVTEKDRTSLSGRALDATEKERTSLSGGVSDATEKERTTLSGRALDATEKEGTPLSRRALDAIEKEGTTLSRRASDVTEKERTTLSGRASDATEIERTRVVDIIRKLTTPSDDNSNDTESSCSPRTSLDAVTGSPVLRGRQAFGDLLTQVRTDRQQELEGLVQRNAVSKFAQKGRIQAMLRVQFLRHGSREAKDLITSSCTSSEVNRLRRSSIKRLSEIFKPASQDSLPRLKSPEKEVIDSSQMKKSTSVKGIKVNTNQNVVDSPPTKISTAEGVAEAIKTIDQHDVADSSQVKKFISTEDVAHSSQLNIFTSTEDYKITKQQEVVDSFQIEKSTFIQDIECTNQQDTPNSSCLEKSTFVEDIKGNDRHKVADSSQTEKSIHVEDIKSTKLQDVIDSSQVEKSTSVEEWKARECLLKSHIVDTAATSKDENEEDEKSILNENYSGVKEVCSVEEDEKTLQPSNLDEHMNSSIDLQESEQINGTFNLRTDDSSVNTPCEWVEEWSSNHYLSESEHGWVSDISHTQVGWEELQSDYERQTDGVQDWICDISRPRSEWEGLRRERYQEMLDPFRQKEDIRVLLERQSVSSFLSSSLRDCIDRLMDSRTHKTKVSHIGRQTDKQATKKESEYNVAREEEENVIEKAEFGDAGYEQDDEGNDEDENQVEKPYEESVAYVDPTSSDIQFTTWNSVHGHGTSEFSEQVGFSSPQQNLSSNSYSQECRRCSTTSNGCSIEMQLIYELRGHMVQLHAEMSEIRKSINSCMNNLLEFHHSVKQDVATHSSNSGQNRGRHSSQKKGVTKRSMCCICYDVQVDCFLYRCGHMCSCFECAHELQRTSGRCPVCQAPIIDVVRAHSNP